MTSAYGSLFTVDDFQPNTIVCDASAPLNVKSNGRIRNDIFVYHGGIASLPNPIDFGFDIGVASSHHLYGCLIEAILYSQYEDLPLSCGRGNISRDSLDTYLKLFTNDFPVKPVYSFGQHIYTEEQLKAYGKRIHYGLQKNNF